jgi:hypothetical protein
MISNRGVLHNHVINSILVYPEGVYRAVGDDNNASCHHYRLKEIERRADSDGKRAKLF